MDQTSYTSVSSALVRKACELFKEHRQKEITERQERIIEKKMKTMFGKRTREQALKIVQADGWSDWYTAGIIWWDTDNRADRLLALCDIADCGDGLVQIDGETSRQLQKYFREAKDV